MNFFKAVYWKFYIIILACRWINSLNLGDKVMYQGREFILVQGVSAPVWVLQAGDYRVEVHANNFKKVNTLENKWNSFKSGYRFYMTSWYSIWMREGVQGWMRGCNIWKN